MESPSSSQNLAATTNLSRSDSVRRRYGALAYLSGRRGALLAAAALGIIGILAGWTWLGTAAVLPLLYTLPCAAMMAVCMRGHGGSANTPTTSGSGTGSGPDLTQ
jgi:hypothetical protein